MRKARLVVLVGLLCAFFSAQAFAASYTAVDVDGKFAITSFYEGDNQVVRLFAAGRQEPLWQKDIPNKRGENVQNLILSRNATFFAISYRSQVKGDEVYSLKTGKIVKTLPPSQWVELLTDSGYIITRVSVGKTRDSFFGIVIYDAETGQEHHRFSGTPDRVSPDGRYLIYATQKPGVAYHAMNMDDKKVLRSWDRNEGGYVAFSNNGQIMLAPSEKARNMLALYDLKNNEVKLLHTINLNLSNLMFLPGDRFLVYPFDGGKIYLAETGEYLGLLNLELSDSRKARARFSEGSLTSMDPLIPIGLREKFEECYLATMQRDFDAVFATDYNGYIDFLNKHQWPYHAYYPERAALLALAVGNVQAEMEREAVLSAGKEEALLRLIDLQSLNQEQADAFIHILAISKQSRGDVPGLLDCCNIKRAGGALKIKIAGMALAAAKEKPNIAGLHAFKASPCATEEQKEEAQKLVYALVDQENSITRYQWFIAEYPVAPERKQAEERIYALVDKEKNIAAYQWFIGTFPDSAKAVTALEKMHALAFAEAKKINSVAAYNDFIVAYPIAAQMKEAERAAYDLEKEENEPGYWSDREKMARGLSIKTRQMRRKMDESGNENYTLVVARMTRLLEELFPTEEATDKHLADQEIMRAMNGLKGRLDVIADNTRVISEQSSQTSRILREQGELMRHHFEKAAEDRKMAEKYAAEHRFWERCLKDK